MFAIAARILKFVLAIGTFRARFYGFGCVPKSGAVAIVGKHQSFWDPPLVGTGVWSWSGRQTHFLAKSILFKFRIFRWWLEGVGAIPIHQAGFNSPGLTVRALYNQRIAAIKTAADVLARGGVLCIFPEGRRAFGDDLSDLAPGGMARIIRQSGVRNIVTVGMAFRFSKWFGVPCARITVLARHFILPEGATSEVNMETLTRELAETQRQAVAIADGKMDPPEN